MGETSQAASRVPLWVKLAYTALAVSLVGCYWVVNWPKFPSEYFWDVALLTTAAGLWLESLLPSIRVPLLVKLVYTAFVAVLVPKYWIDYGPTNFLYYCDIALLLMVPALWLESPFLASMPAVGILLPQALWQVDFLGEAIGVPVVSLTGYMFSETLPLFTRGLSFFHFWLPFLVVWLVWRLGYDRRAFIAWTVLAWVAMPVCYFLLPPPPAPAETPNLPTNVNYVYGFSTTGPQQWMHPLLYLALLMVGMPLVIFWPTHLMLNKLFGPKEPDAQARK